MSNTKSHDSSYSTIMHPLLNEMDLSFDFYKNFSSNTSQNIISHKKAFCDNEGTQEVQSQNKNNLQTALNALQMDVKKSSSKTESLDMQTTDLDLNSQKKNGVFNIQLISHPNKYKTKLWTEDEDKILIEKAKEYGFKHWKKISQFLNGKTKIQCYSRFKVIGKQIKKGHWTEDEDKNLLILHKKYGNDWGKISKEMISRSDKQIRERYLNSLVPGLNKNKFTEEEDEKIMKYFLIYGKCWQAIAQKFKGRTQDTIRVRFNSAIRKKLIAKGINPDKMKKNAIFMKKKRKRTKRDAFPRQIIFTVEKVNKQDNSNEINSQQNNENKINLINDKNLNNLNIEEDKIKHEEENIKDKNIKNIFEDVNNNFNAKDSKDLEDELNKILGIHSGYQNFNEDFNNQVKNNEPDIFKNSNESSEYFCLFSDYNQFKDCCSIDSYHNYLDNNVNNINNINNDSCFII